MKKLLIITALCYTFIGYSQEVVELGAAGGSFGFEHPSQYQIIKIDSSNIWFISTPNKNILFPINPFNKYAIITDTSLYYPSNIKSSFNFRLVLGQGSYYLIQFFHKYDFELNKDGGYIETSYDNGLSWQNIIYDTLIQNNVEDITNFYTASDTIISAQNQPGFTGRQTDYLASKIRFTAKEENFLDTMLLRFTIVTDSMNANNEGWMLDDFTFLGGYTLIKENLINDELLIYPNPAGELLIINCPNINISKISILSNQGKTLIQETGQNITSINIGNLVSGYYIVLCESLENDQWITKIFKICI